jgi:RNA polymerase sigma-70 factor (ECF subfamily)
MTALFSEVRYMSTDVYKITPEQWETFRRILTSKVRSHLGYFCADIEDLVQDTLLRFHRALDIGTLRQPGCLGAFLNGICNNVIWEYRRRLWRQLAHDTKADSGCLVAHVAGQLEIQNLIDSALENLSSRDRAVLTAFYLEEQEREAICRNMGLTDAQFRVIIFRAKERMRKFMLKSNGTSARRSGDGSVRISARPSRIHR